MILIMSSLFVFPGAPSTDTCIIASGQHLFRMDDRVLALFEVIDGEITLERGGAGGARLVLQRARRGDIVAEASLFSESYHCDAIAIAPTEVRSIGIGSVRDHLARNPEALWSLARDLAHHVQRARLRAEMLSMRRLSDRIDAWLMMNTCNLPSKGKWLPLAAELGVTPEALYRELARRR
jgi:CRP/FNR family transcriptional regulator, dissimilatory nitrate respiration regulator